MLNFTRIVFVWALLLTASGTLAVTPAKAQETAGPGGEVRLYLMPAFPVRMDWRTPRSLIRSSINALGVNRNHMIGHVTVEVSCPTVTGELNHFSAGAAPSSPVDNAVLLIKHKVGLSILEASWPGRIENESEISKSIKKRSRSRETLAAVTFDISEGSCKRMLQYFREYSETTTPLFYGNSPRPRRKEGSGCSAFGVSFLEVAGVMTEELRQDWITARRVPLNAMGGYGLEKITIRETLLDPNTERWALPHEPHMALETFDPDKMHDWVTNLIDYPEQLRALGGTVDTALSVTFPEVPAVRFDRRMVPTPTEPIFLSEPLLAPYKGNSVIRSDKKIRANGGFDLKP